MPEILHVSPVMPVDEHHIEYALDSAGYGGELVTSWLPSPMEFAVMRMVPTIRRRMRRDPVRSRNRPVVRHVWPDLRHEFDIRTQALDSDILAHDDFFRAVDRRAAKRVNEDTRMVIGREFGCRQTFQQAQAFGAKCLYHLPTAHHGTLQRILQTEKAQYPGVCSSTFDSMEFDAERMYNKAEEIRLADRILCPSGFVKRTLIESGTPEAQISVVPFGCEASWIGERKHQARPTFLFVGNISARKGAHRLLQVWKALKAYRTHRLLLVGSMHLTPAFLQDYHGLYEHIPRLPREDLREIYLSASALVLPALAEGFALVILEALSCGTPVLASRNSGADGFLEEGREARLFAAQDNEALAEHLEWALTHPHELEALGQQGQRRAQSWPWIQFQKRIQETLNSMV